MRKQGNRNFGVWNPPTGMDSIRRSVQTDFNLIVRLNNPKLGKELGIQQSFGEDIKKFEYYEENLVGAVNNKSKIFDNMIRQGWGGNL